MTPDQWTLSPIPSVQCVSEIRSGFPFLTSVQGGNVLGNGTWLNVGGNQAVTYGGAEAQSQNGGAPFDDPDGGKSYVKSQLQE